MTSMFTGEQYNNILRSYHPDCCHGEVCSACGAVGADPKTCNARPSFTCMELWRGAIRHDRNAALGIVLDDAALNDGQLLDAAARRIFAIERNWRPIETAPKDGTPVLLLCEKFAGELSQPFTEDEYQHSVEAGIYSTGLSDYPGDNWWDLGGDGYATWGWPTHWQPLPPPPFKGWPIANGEIQNESV